MQLAEDGRPARRELGQVQFLDHLVADLLQRPMYFDWQHFDVASVPPRGLILATRNDAPVIAAGESGALTRLVNVAEPGDPPYFVIFER